MYQFGGELWAARQVNEEPQSLFGVSCLGLQQFDASLEDPVSTEQRQQVFGRKRGTGVEVGEHGIAIGGCERHAQQNEYRQAHPASTKVLESTIPLRRACPIVGEVVLHAPCHGGMRYESWSAPRRTASCVPQCGLISAHSRLQLTSRAIAR